MHALVKTLARISDDELLQRLKRLAHGEGVVTAYLIAHLAELDQRGLHLGQGYSSLFTYCIQVLHLSESSAYRRIEAGRAVRRCPLLLERLVDGSLNLTGILLLAEHLDDERLADLIEMARHRTTRQIEELLARFHPLPPVPSRVRKLPAPRSAGLTSKAETENAPGILAGLLPESLPACASVPAASLRIENSTESVPMAPLRHRPVIAPLSPDRYKVQFTARSETYRKLRLVQDLMRHQIPNGDPADIFDHALSALLEKLARQKFAATDRPRRAPAASRRSRRIPASVRRTVWQRDQGQCAFRGIDGHRCEETGRLEFHHVKPYALGGESNLENIELRCRAHNVYEAKQAGGWGLLEFLTESDTCLQLAAQRVQVIL